MLRFSFFVICLIFQAEMFIGLLLRAMKNDVNLKRVAAFAKRMLQVSNKIHFSVIVLIWGRVFFFLISKSNIYIYEKEHKAPNKYTRVQGNTTHSHLYPIQAKNPTNEFKLSTLYTLAHPHKVNRKEDFIL